MRFSTLASERGILRRYRRTHVWTEFPASCISLALVRPRFAFGLGEYCVLKWFSVVANTSGVGLGEEDPSDK